MPMLPEDWRRLLLAVEVVFVSDVVGSGLDWSVTTGFPDGDRIALLRGIQRKMPRWRSSFQFTTPEEGQTTVLDAERLEAERRVAPALRAREKRIATHTRCWERTTRVLPPA